MQNHSTFKWIFKNRTYRCLGHVGRVCVCVVLPFFTLLPPALVHKPTLTHSHTLTLFTRTFLFTRALCTEETVRRNTATVLLNVEVARLELDSEERKKGLVSSHYGKEIQTLM